MNSVQKKIVRAFTKKNVLIRRDVVVILQKEIERYDDTDEVLSTILEAVVNHLERNPGGSKTVDAETIKAVLHELAEDDDDVAERATQAFSSFDLPKFQYDVGKKTFFRTPTSKFSLHAQAQSKIDLYRERFTLIHQRLMRNPMFTSAANANTSRSQVALSPVESLEASKGTMFALGMITQPEEGRFFLEDLRHKIPMDLSKVKTALGLFTETSIVLAQGQMVDGKFQVEVLGLPPPERREQSLISMGIIDPLQVIPTPADYRREEELQKKCTDAMFVVLSDVHLDVPKTFEELRQMFMGYSLAKVIPSMLVLMGNFLSRPFGQGRKDASLFKRCMDQLADLIASFPEMASKTQFVLVPGPTDPGSAPVLPRPRLPKAFTKQLERAADRIVFASNPCRLKFYTQEIAIFRNDIVERLQRHSLLTPTTSIDGRKAMSTAKLAVHTIVDQGHMCPLPMHLQPLYWEYDYALRMYPLPDVLLLGDRHEIFHFSYEDVTVCNPGSFAQDSSFIVYRPSQRVAELSSIRPPDVEEDEEAKENGSGERKEEELLLSPRRRPAAERATKQPTLMQVAPQLEPRRSTQAKQQEDKDEGKDEGEEEEEEEDEGDTEMMPEKTLPQTVETAEEADVEME